MADKREWSEMKKRKMNISENVLSKVAGGIKIIEENKALDLELPFYHWFEWFSDASDEVLGWTINGKMARESCLAWLIDQPIYYKELWAV